MIMTRVTLYLERMIIWQLIIRTPTALPKFRNQGKFSWNRPEVRNSIQFWERFSKVCGLSNAFTDKIQQRLLFA